MGGHAGVDACPERCWGPSRGVAKNLSRFRPAGSLFFPAILERLPSLNRNLSFSARAKAFYFTGGLSGRLTCAGLLQCLPVIPGHPVRRVLGQFLGVFLQFDQVLEGIDAV